LGNFRAGSARPVVRAAHAQRLILLALRLVLVGGAKVVVISRFFLLIFTL